MNNSFMNNPELFFINGDKKIIWQQWMWNGGPILEDGVQNSRFDRKIWLLSEDKDSRFFQLSIYGWVEFYLHFTVFYYYFFW